MNFERVIQAGENEATLRQPVIGSAARCADRALAVVDLIAAGQPDNFLAVIWQMGGRHQHFVRQQVVDPVSPGGCGIAEIGNLNGCGPTGQNAVATAVGMALQIDGDIDFQRLYQIGDSAVRLIRNVDEAVEAGMKPGADWLVAGLAIGQRNNLETIAAMKLEQFRHEEGGRVGVQIGGQVGEPDTSARGSCPAWRCGPTEWRCQRLPAAQLQATTVAECYLEEMQHAGTAAVQVPLGRRAQGRMVAPVTDE